MKKMLMCCGALCLTLLLFCGTALALDVAVTPANGANAQVDKSAKGDDVTFKVTKSDAEKEKLYLIMIQEGADASANPKPDKDNLYYLNVEAGSAFPLEAYPKTLEAEKSYVVYLSDYSADNNGAAKGIAVISTKTATTPGDGDNGDSNTNPGGDNGDSNTNPGDNTGDGICGDVNGDGKVLRNDRIILTRYLADSNGDYGPGKKYNVVEANADVNGDGKVLRNDRIILTRHLAGLPGYETLPYSNK